MKSSSKKTPLEIIFLSLFPEPLEAFLSHSILKRAQTKKILKTKVIQIRDFAKDKHRTVDDRPYGGGEGMLLRADVLFDAWKKAKGKSTSCLTIFLTPQGRVWNQGQARELVSRLPSKLILVCGHYEGVDERFIEECVDLEVSVGNFVLTGGELPALIVADSLVRLMPEVLGNDLSSARDSLERNLLKYPQYTRPPEFRGRKIPEILLSGDHAKIEAWRENERVERTRRKRPDLLPK